MASLAWGGHVNGRIPDGALMRVPWQQYHRLRADACRSLIALNVRYRARYGENIYLTDGYREFAVQEKIFRERYVRGVPQGTGDSRFWLGAWWYRRSGTASASVPGLSNHGWALACDFGDGVNDERSERHRWMRANAPSVGWIHPTWAHDNVASNGSQEPWHFEYPVTVTVPGAPPTQEDEDVVTPQDRAEIAAAAGTAAANAVLNAIGPAMTELVRVSTMGTEHAAAATREARAAGDVARLALPLAERIALEVAQTFAATGEAREAAQQAAREVVQVRARMPRASRAQYQRITAESYDDLVERARGITYEGLSGALDGMPVTVSDEDVARIATEVGHIDAAAIVSLVGARLS